MINKNEIVPYKSSNETQLDIKIKSEYDSVYSRYYYIYKPFLDLLNFYHLIKKEED
ncbi:hypothetical protein [uncultured Clostridium sp.]|uniref:hypothetical protein n=1 Tax=uncultured Clostridium sp. TaxID=59620 RepID=UPI00263B7E75|nr:hypothetical protein [uncultured Clostridium sp.]